jgi:putative phosphoesterase
VRVAIVSDIHGNLAALEAVVEDLGRERPDLVVQGGDLALNGPRPAEVVSRVRELGWPGIVGNTDRAIWELDTVPGAVYKVFQSLAPATRALLGEDHVRWLQTLPEEWRDDGEGIALVHAAPGDLWKNVRADSPDRELENVFSVLGAPLAVYCHIHRPFITAMPGLTVANSGSLGMPFDGDWRPSYLLVEDGEPRIKRVEYDLEREVAALEKSDYPFKEALIEGRRRAAPPEFLRASRPGA